MKQINILSAMILAGGLSMSAQSEYAPYFTEDFQEMSMKGELLVGDWITYGNGATPYHTEDSSTDLLQYFQPGGADTPVYDYVLLNNGDYAFAMSCGSFNLVDDVRPTTDQWLITPEIEILEDDAVFMFTAATYTTTYWGVNSATFELLVSEGGTAKEDFTSVMTDYVSSNNGKFVTRNFAGIINGYKGKKVRFAFVNKSTANVGLLGITNIIVGNYAADIENQTERTAVPGDKVYVHLNVGLKVPQKCKRARVELEYDDVKAVTYAEADYGSVSHKVVYIECEFDENPIVMTNKPVYYTVTITPEFYDDNIGYTPLPVILKGTITVPEKYWPNNVVIEEGTATGCSYCTRGIAALEYFAHNYPGSDTEGKAIPIGVHGVMNYKDPMNEGVETYITALAALNGTGNLPLAMFNRATRGKDPANLQEFQRAFNKQAIYKAEIKGISFPDNPTFGDKLTVNFDVRSGFTAENMPLLVACVLLEDNVKGHNSNYNQANNYAMLSTDQVAAQGFGFIREEMAQFCSGGKLGMSTIPFDQMTYQHVARGIWPDFLGTNFGKDWVADTPVDGSLTFEFPTNITGILSGSDAVIDTENLSAVILVMDPMDRYAIVASDIAQLNAKHTSVKESAAGIASASRLGNLVSVNAPEGSYAEIYSVDGIRHAAFAVNGQTSAEVAAPGVLIVRIQTPSGVETIKL